MKGELQQKIPHAPDCKHYSVGVLHMIIEGEIYIAISCYLCKSICLYNPGEDTHITAFQQEGIEPGEICHGGYIIIIKVVLQGSFSIAFSHSYGKLAETLLLPHKQPFFGTSCFF